MKILYSDFNWHDVAISRARLYGINSGLTFQWHNILKFSDTQERWYCPFCGRVYSDNGRCICCISSLKYGIHPITEFQKTHLPTVSLWKQISPKYLRTQANKYGVICSLMTPSGNYVWWFNDNPYYLNCCLWKPYAANRKIIVELKRLFNAMEGGVRNENITCGLNEMARS